MLKKSACFLVLALTVVSTAVGQEGAETPAKGSRLRVGVYEGGGSGGNGAFEWARLVEDSPEAELVVLDGEKIRQGALDRLDLVIMPGGSASREQKAIGPDGMDALRAFIRRGGAYLGTCAGAYLMLERFGRVVPFVYRGQDYHTHIVSLDLNERGAGAMGIGKGLRKVRYHGGPFMYPSTNAVDGASFEVWETFASEATGQGRVKPQMFGAAATVAGTYGRGRVLVMACHPEYSLSTRRTIALPAIRWLTGRDLTLPARNRRPRALAVGWYSGSTTDGAANVSGFIELVRRAELDVVPVSGDTVEEGALDHVDALVLPTASEKAKAAFLKPHVSDSVRAFLSRGGRLVAIGSGSELVPKGAAFKAVASPQEVLAALREFFD